MPASDDATRKQAPSTLSHSTARTARIHVGFLPHARSNTWSFVKGGMAFEFDNPKHDIQKR